MKYAFCFSGLLRSYNETLPTFLNSFNEILNDSDIFMHMWHEESETKRMDAISMLKPKDIILENQITKETAYLRWPGARDKSAADRDFSNVQNMYFGVNKVFELCKSYEQKNNKNYDVIFRVRYDHYYENKFNIEDLNLIDNNSIVFPNEKDYFGICDQWAFGNSESMHKYSNIWLNLDHLIMERKNMVNPESLLKIHIIDNGINIKRCDIKFKIVYSEK